MSNGMDIMVMKFADSKIPSFVEVNNKEYILCGEKNDYPEYLIHQYNKCGKHRAIINGKVKYIIGDGLQGGVWAVSEDGGQKREAETVNDCGETMTDVLAKSVKDIEIHGGFRWFITVDKAGRITDIKHADFYKFRTAKPTESVDPKTKAKVVSNGYYYKDKWVKQNGYQDREDPVFYREFTGKPAAGETKLTGTYVFAYNEYGPGTDYYPLPEYVACANYIDLDIEISKFHLSNVKNGMMPSKMINFFTGEPTEEKKKQIEKRFAEKFAGSENAGKFVFVFNPSGDKSQGAEISDLSFGDLDKQFDLLSKTVQQEIFTGHQVVSPMLFGVKTEGQLGGSTELRVAYEVFTNAYAKPKQTALEKIVNTFGRLMGKGDGYKFKQLDPVGMILDINDFKDLLPREFVLEKLGVPKQYITPEVGPNVAPGQVQPTIPGQVNAPAITAPQAQEVNTTITNLTAKQHQQVMRIIRQYSKGQVSPEAAKTLLKSGYGFSESEINSLLGIEDQEEFELTKKLSFEEHRQLEIDEAVRPNIKLNYITDKKVLGKKIMYPVCDSQGNVVNMKVSVAKVQDKIRERMNAIENEIKQLYAS